MALKMLTIDPILTSSLTKILKQIFLWIFFNLKVTYQFWSQIEEHCHLNQCN